MTQPIPTALALHTTTSNLGLCLSDSGQEISTQTWDLGRELSAHLHEILQTFTQPYELSQLDYIAVATGPGGFTSTRIGVVTARTLAQQLGVPLFGISSLAALAWQWAIASSPVIDSSSDLNGKDMPAIALQMPARRGQLFTAIYSLEACADSNTQMNCNHPTEAMWSSDGVIAEVATRKKAATDDVMHSQEGRPRSFEPWPFRLHSYRPVQVLDPDLWQRELAQLSHQINVISVEGDLGHTVVNVLDLAEQEYRAGTRPHWSSVHPFYGQSPV